MGSSYSHWSVSIPIINVYLCEIQKHLYKLWFWSLNYVLSINFIIELWLCQYTGLKSLKDARFVLFDS